MRIKKLFLLCFLCLQIGLSGQVLLKQIERDSAKWMVPVTKVLVPSNSTYYQDYISLELLLDSLGYDISGLNPDSIYVEFDTIRLRDGSGFVVLLDNDPTNEIDSFYYAEGWRYSGDTLDIFTQPLDSIYIDSDTIRLRDGDGFVAMFPYFDTDVDSVTYDSVTNILTVWEDGTGYGTTISGGGMDSLYNGNRNIARVPTAGVNLGATTFREWLDWWYIQSYTQPTLSMNSISPTLVEVGSSTGYTIAGSMSNPCAYTLSNGSVPLLSYNFGSSPTYSSGYTHQPTTHSTTTITAQQDWTMTTTQCEAGTPTAGTKTASRTITNRFPVLWGMSATVYDNTNNPPYAGWSKRVTLESNQTGLTMTGTNEYMYIMIPKSWTDYTVLSIIDHNGFNVTPSFTAYDVSITSTGLTNNWVQNYKLYKLNNLTTASGFDYTYNK